MTRLSDKAHPRSFIVKRQRILVAPLLVSELDLQPRDDIMKLKHAFSATGLAIALTSIAHATTYYVSTKATASTFAGTSSLFPFKTLKTAASKVKPGDTLLLERGSIWEETLPLMKGVTYDGRIQK
jgi:hypothetical protein